MKKDEYDSYRRMMNTTPMPFWKAALVLGVVTVVLGLLWVFVVVGFFDLFPGLN